MGMGPMGHQGPHNGYMNGGEDNSFEQEVEPIQRQLENRFHPQHESALGSGPQPHHQM